jgi:hypothetical protein
MSHKDWVKSQLELIGIKRLTPEQKEEYQSEMQAYSKRRTKVQEEVSDLQEEISLLEKGLMQHIPTISNAEYIHSGPTGCGFKAVFSLPKGHDKDTYYCMFCEQDFQLEADGPHRIDTKDPLILNKPNS